MTGNYFKNNNLKILSFEPVKEHFELLYKNINLNNLDEKNKISIFNFGLYDKDFETVINYNFKCSSSSSITYKSNNDIELPITLKSFDSLNIDLAEYDDVVIKIDVEGSEINALKGMSVFLKNKNVTLLIEDLFGEKLIPYLKESNFIFLNKITHYNSWWYRK